MNKKGFTLIELLAVIVILAIIALIATPIVLNMIDSARKSAAKSSALGYIEAIEYNNGFAELGTDANLPETYTKVTSGDISNINIKSKGKKPESGTVTINSDGKVTEATLCVNGYTVTYNGKEVTDVTKGCSSSSSNTPTTYTVFNPSDTVKYDPVANDKCTSGDTCYIWRVITVGDTTSDSEITIQMDHNLINKDKWTTGNSTASGPDKILSRLATETENWSNELLLNYTYDTTTATNNYGILTCTSGSCTITGNSTPIATGVKARVITGEEIRALTMYAGAASGTMADNWTLSRDHNNNFYFSNTDFTIGTRTSGTGSTTLSWLIENTETDGHAGATSNSYGLSNDGYWTLSPLSNGSDGAWFITKYGNLNANAINSSSTCGFRPVITISKSALQ